MGEKNAVQPVVGFIVWAFRRLKNPRSREMSARGYALHSVRPQLLSYSTRRLTTPIGLALGADSLRVFVLVTQWTGGPCPGRHVTEEVKLPCSMAVNRHVVTASRS